MKKGRKKQVVTLGQFVMQGNAGCYLRSHFKKHLMMESKADVAKAKVATKKILKILREECDGVVHIALMLTADRCLKDAERAVKERGRQVTKLTKEMPI